MDRYVSEGFHMTMVVFLNSCLEDLVRSYLIFKLMKNQGAAESALRKSRNVIQKLIDPFTREEEDVSTTLDFEAEAYSRITDNKAEQLKKATFNRLGLEHKVILGQSIADFIGHDHFQMWDALNAYRNLVGHGGEFKIDISQEETRSNLSKVLALHNKSGLADTVKLSDLEIGGSIKDAFSIFEILMKEDFMLYLTEKSNEFNVAYRAKISADRQFQYVDVLPKFNSI